jgi:hypothetical protein
MINWKSISELNGPMAEYLKLNQIKDYYEVSNTGLIRNKVTNKQLSLENAKDGYQRVAMVLKQQKTLSITRKIHIQRLVALAFLGEPENISLQVDHIDRDRSNNNVENLRWVSASENCNNKVFHGRQTKDRSIWFDGSIIYHEEKHIKEYCKDKTKLIEYKYKQYLDRLKIENSIKFDDEKWTNVRYNDNDFKVSNKGRIHIEQYNKNTFGTKCDAGYFNITKYGQTFRVHRLIALGFLQDELKELCEKTSLDVDKLVVNHKDNCGFNNNVSNLEWTTVSENTIHAVKIGARKTRSIARKLGNEIKEYSSIQEAVNDLNKKDKAKSRKAIEACLKSNINKEPSHISQGYIWYYL